MKVSIVTISLNQAPFLERAILSVVEQDHDDIEYIVVDPGSTDGSRDIIERYRDRISVAVLKPDAGPADGLNMGFARATGDIFGYINADDAYLPGAIGKAVDAFRASPAADVVCGHGFIVNANGAVRRRFYSDQFSAWRYVHGGVTVMQQSTFFAATHFKPLVASISKIEFGGTASCCWTCAWREADSPWSTTSGRYLRFTKPRFRDSVEAKAR